MNEQEISEIVLFLRFGNANKANPDYIWKSKAEIANILKLTVEHINLILAGKIDRISKWPGQTRK